ncbi:MAG: type II toxin-antitoxin system Phd/YefM family antitoxin [Candidatus Eisenbacteria bacterium]|nr:type II toxin-antitoxin system Phd/YefM family antitoxin [Candidatus Eisenbacteria bacterium]
MLDLSKDIRSLSDFKRHTPEFTAALKETGRPVVLTVNGAASLVVQDAEAYQRLVELAERAEAVEGIRRGLEAMARGDGIPADAVLADLRKKLGSPKAS